MAEPHVLGTHRELADKKIAEYAAKVRDGVGNPLIVREMLDKWLEYRHGHQTAGTLDELAVL